jgi:outer membrane protein assembly factor BamA
LRVKASFTSLIIFIAAFQMFAQQVSVQMSFRTAPHKKEVLFPDEMLEIDSLALNAMIDGRLARLYELGYLSATYRQSAQGPSNLSVDFFTGDIFKMLQLKQGTVSDEMMNKIGFRPLHHQNKPFSQGRLLQLFNSILNYSENHGYPFASVKLDSITFSKGGLSAEINYRSGPFITFDSLYVLGYAGVKPEYIMTHLGIYPGKPYEEKIVDEIPNKVALLDFVSLARSPEVVIRNGKCSVRLYLEEEKVSQVDGIVGVLPRERGENKLLITGQLMLDLHNLFSSGKQLTFRWQRFNEQSQMLHAGYRHPNLFRTPVHAAFMFDLLKQDTSFLNRSLMLELSILTKNSSHIGFEADFRTSRLISTAGLEDVSELPANNDFNVNYYGIRYEITRLNSVGQPTEGWALALVGSVGQKKIIQNPLISDDAYSGLDLNALQMKLEAKIDKYWTLKPFLILRTQLLAGHVGSKKLFPADLFRLGGLQTLRGFTEKSFFASSFGIFNLEMRAYLDSDTYFMLFYDQGAIRNDIDETGHFQYPLGAGSGFSFQTSSGLFSFVLALGKSVEQPFGFNYAKIHFGYISRF